MDTKSKQRTKENMSQTVHTVIPGTDVCQIIVVSLSFLILDVVSGEKIVPM